MIQRIHILTAEEHRRLMVDPDKNWLTEQGDSKYRAKYFAASAPYVVSKDDQAPGAVVRHVFIPTAYTWPVLDTTGMRTYGKPVAYFTNGYESLKWADKENAKCPPPPKPPNTAATVSIRHLLRRRNGYQSV